MIQIEYIKKCIDCKSTSSKKFQQLGSEIWQEVESKGLVRKFWSASCMLCNVCYIKYVINLIRKEKKSTKSKTYLLIRTKITNKTFTNNINKLAKSNTNNDKAKSHY